MPYRTRIAAALIAVAALPAASAQAAAPSSVTKLSTPQDDYVLNSIAQTTVKAKLRKAGKLKVYADGALVAAVKLPKGRAKRTVPVALIKLGEVELKACVARSCKTKTVRVSLPLGGPAMPQQPKTYPLTLTAGTTEVNTDGRRTAADAGSCSGKFDLHGIHKRSAALASPVTEADNVMTVNPDGTIEGQAIATAPHTSTWSTLKGCKEAPGGGLESCTTSRQRTGTTSVGFSFESTPGDPSTVTLSWTTPDADVGFVDYGSEVCNVHPIAQYFDDAAQRTVVPVKDFISGTPKTFSLSGSDSWAEDFTGKPATISASFATSVTVVRAAG